VLALITKLAPMVKLTRVTTGFGAVGNLWFVILWTRATTSEPGAGSLDSIPLWSALGGGMLVGIGLYAFGAALNDLLDHRRDRALSAPNHPIVEGAASLEFAVCAVAGSLVLAILGATVFGTGAILLTLALGVAILAFNTFGKFVPGVGLVLLSVIYAGHMLIPNIALAFLLPVWLVMTHAIGVLALAQTLGRKSPPLSRRAAAFALAGWGGCSLVLLWLAWMRRAPAPLWPEDVPAFALVYPATGVALFGAFVARRARRHGLGPKLGERINRYGAIWPAFYGCAWLLGAGHTGSALLMGALIVTGIGAMVTIRELGALAQQPVGYRL